jgi:hypothetical protein
MIVISTYASYSDSQKRDLVNNLGINTLNYINNPISIFTTIIFIVCFYLVVYVFRLPMESGSKPITLSIIETSSWLLLIVIIFTDFFKYILNISLSDLLFDLFGWIDLHDYSPIEVKGNISGNTKLSSTSISTTSLPLQKDEVFNVSNNLYTYDDAQAVCSAYGATLANYDQMEDAYKNGAEWCNYGWSDGQMAFFPTQKSTWNKLQKTDNHKNDCGRPGVNGGYFANPYIKFGVNCYGKKPKASDADLNRMNAQNNTVYPKNANDVLLDRKVKFWKDNADKLLVLNSFNKKDWSEY